MMISISAGLMRRTEEEKKDAALSRAATINTKTDEEKRLTVNRRSAGRQRRDPKPGGGFY